MSFYMMHSHQWKFLGVGDGFRFCYAYKKGTYQSRSVSYANGIQIVQSHLCICKGLLNNLVDLFNMFT